MANQSMINYGDGQVTMAWIMLNNLSTLVFGLIHRSHGVSTLTNLFPKLINVLVFLGEFVILPKATLNLLFKSLILPHFDYCDVVWGNAGTSHLSRLDKLQNTAGKVILGLPRRFPTDVLLEMLDWKRLSDRRSTHLNILVKPYS